MKNENNERKMKNKENWKWNYEMKKRDYNIFEMKNKDWKKKNEWVMKIIKWKEEKNKI